MTAEFIPYQQALALKELGFDEPCFGWFRSTLIPSNFTEYFLDIEFGMNESPSDWVNSNFLDKTCSAPLYQQAFRWFREKHDLDSFVNSEWKQTVKVGHYFNAGDYYSPQPSHLTYEEAELACLKKLIEIVKLKKTNL